MKISTELKEAMEMVKATKNYVDNVEISTQNSSNNNKAKKKFEAPRHDLKIIIAKKSSCRSKYIGFGRNKIKLNKPNGNSSKTLSDFERLRGDVDSVQFSSASSSEIVSTSEMKTTLSKKTGTVSHHDLKLENKSNTKKHNSSGHSNSHDYYKSTTLNEREKEKCYSSLEKQQRRESTKHAKNNEKLEKLIASKCNSIPKLKIELPSLKTKITVPKTPTDTYVIASKSPLNSPKCFESPLKKVRFDISSKTSNEGCYDFNDEADINSVDQTEYAERIGLKPVERKVESIILHRKRKKSKHSKEIEHSKRSKLHVSSSLDESLKLKLKIMGGKSCKSDKKSNEEEASSTCNLRVVSCKLGDLTSINVQEAKNKQKEAASVAAADAVVELEKHKYSVTEQKNAKSGSDQPMVFIPKLVLQKLQNVASAKNTVTDNATERRSSFILEQTNSLESEKSKKPELKIKPFIGNPTSESSSQKLMKPPYAKMGSPQQSQISSTFSLSPIRPHSIPASLKLSPISRLTSSVSPKNDFQSQSFKRSLSLGAEKSSPSYLNAYIKPNKHPFPTTMPDVQYSKVPPLIPSSSSIRSFYGSMNNNTIATANKSQSPHLSLKLPNINVKDPTKLFPNACSSVEILKIPQKTYSPMNNIKLNRQPPTIPLEKIRKSIQGSVSQKVLLKAQPSQYLMKTHGFHQSPQNSNQALNYSGIYQTPLNQDISLERYTLELTHDIAKLDHNLSLEKNFEHWEKRKLEEFYKSNDLKNFTLTSKNMLNQQNLSVRNIPNPSAINLMSRNQTSGFNSEIRNNFPNSLSHQKETVTSTNSESSDVEEMLSKSMIAKPNEKQTTILFSSKSPVSKVNDKKSIEKLTEYLRLTAAKSKDVDDDNNNNNSKNESLLNVRNFNLIEGKSDKFVNVNVPSVDVICIDS